MRHHFCKYHHKKQTGPTELLLILPAFPLPSSIQPINLQKEEKIRGGSSQIDHIKRRAFLGCRREEAGRRRTQTDQKTEPSLLSALPSHNKKGTATGG